MSFGFSIGDLALCMKGLWTVIDRLRGEATDEFMRYKHMYSELEIVVGFLQESLGRRHRALFLKELLAIHTLLHDFFSRIKQLKPFLGSQRKRRSFLGAIAKIFWPNHAKGLQKLHEDLFYRIQLIITKKTLQLEPQEGFILRDPKGRRHDVTFAKVSTWERMHEYVLGIFPAGDPARVAIHSRSYLFHKTSTGQDLLGSAHCIKPFSEVVMRDDRIDMSIIFSYDARYRNRCPKCDRTRLIRGTARQCDSCGLVLRFRDSCETEPDPLTKIVLDGIRSTGTRDFYLDEMNTQRRQPQGAARSTDISSNHALQAAYQGALGDIERSYHNFAQSRQPQIADFSRVTLCTAWWPCPSRHEGHQNATKQLSRTIESLKMSLNNINAQDLPFLIAARALNSRIARYETAVAAFIESVIKAYKSQETPGNSVPDRTFDTDRIMASFHPLPLRVRCLAWIQWDMLAFQERILRASSAILEHFGKFERRETPLFAKIFTLPHTVILLPLWRLTIDVVEDLAQLFAAEKPVYLISAVRHLLKRPASLSSCYFLDGNLEQYVKEFGAEDKGLEKESAPAFQRWLETVVRQGMDEKSKRDLHSCFTQHM